MISELPVFFRCRGESLIGILALPRTQSTDQGVLIIVGGPQYRAGSHRQFTLVARHLAENGIPCMRFDYRGMGDSTGTVRNFSMIDDDICAAIDKFAEETPKLKRVFLWGLCDGASAACFYAPKDKRVRGLILLNPWVRTEIGAAKTYLKHYYIGRLFDSTFWEKMLSGRVSILTSLLELRTALRLAFSRTKGSASTITLPSRMLDCLLRADVPIMFMLSGRDYVANEFDEITKTDAKWSNLLARSTVKRLKLADHTFSQEQWHERILKNTVEWLKTQNISAPSA